MFLIIQEGPLKGQKFPIHASLSLGRSKADIDLGDPKASAIHAHIQELKPGHYVLVDNNSTNGTKIDGNRQKEIPLTPGVQFQIGQSFLSVEESPQPKKQASKPKSPPPSPPEESLSQIDLDQMTWNEFFSETCHSRIKKLKDKKLPLAPFSPMIYLNVVRGLQAKTCWAIGYGPRQIGPCSLEFPLFEEDLPKTCFEVHPHPQGAQFMTSHPEKVLLNGKSISADLLKDGDVISIHETHIEVLFEK